MKIISWNVNGIRAVQKKGFMEWFQESKADVICVQETKADVDKIPDELKNIPGYHSYFHSCSIKSGYSGVGVFTRIKPNNVTEKIGIEEFDGEGRILEVDFGEFILYNVYFPNGSSENKRVPFKLRFYDALLSRCNAQRAEGKRIVVCGDYNIAHHPIDLARPKENESNTGFLPEERVVLDSMVANGWLDTFREFHPEEPDNYTYWDYFTRARERNVGWRIDYQIVSAGLAGAARAAHIHKASRFSDHAPLVMDYDL